jgi:hypothetical protein
MGVFGGGGGSLASSSGDEDEAPAGPASTGSGSSFESPRGSGRGTAPASLEALDEEDGGHKPRRWGQKVLRGCWGAPAADAGKAGAGTAGRSQGDAPRSSWFSLQWAKFKLMKVGGGCNCCSCCHCLAWGLPLQRGVGVPAAATQSC